MTIVLEQGHGFARRLKRKVEMRLRTVCSCFQIEIGRRVIEKAQGKLHTQHRPDRPIQVRLRKRTLMNTFGKSPLIVFMPKIVELHIDARFDGYACSLLRSGGNAVHGVKTLDCAQVGEHESLKPPFLAKYLLQQERVRCNGRSEEHT